MELKSGKRIKILTPDNISDKYIRTIYDVRHYISGNLCSRWQHDMRSLRFPDDREREIIFKYPARKNSPIGFYTRFQCVRCNKEKTVEKSGFVYVGYGKVSCYKCCSREELEVALHNATGGRDPRATEWME